MSPENLKLIVRKIKGKQSAAAKGKLLEDDEDQENDAPPTTATHAWDERSDNMMMFKPTMKQQAQQLVKDLNSATTTNVSDKNGILSERSHNYLKSTSSSMATKQTTKATRVSLDQSMMTAEDLAAVAKLKSLRAIPHQCIIDGNYQQHMFKENSPRLPLPNHHKEEKDPLQPAPYVLYPSETGSVVKVTRDWYVQTIQNNKAANHRDVLVI